MIQLTSTTLRDRVFEYADHCISGGFIITDKTRAAIETIITTIDDNKQGVLICGNPGAGKTLLFEVIRRVIHPKDANFFIKKTCQDVVLDFNTKGHIIFKEGGFFKYNIMWDDLGFEKPGKWYGSQTEVMCEMMFMAHNNFLDKGVKMHFTTMFLPQEIEARYGTWFFSRLKQMCTIVALDPECDHRTAKNFKGFPKVFHPVRLTPEQIEWNKRYEESKNNPPVSEPFKGVGSLFRDKITAMFPKTTTT